MCICLKVHEPLVLHPKDYLKEMRIFFNVWILSGFGV